MIDNVLILHVWPTLVISVHESSVDDSLPLTMNISRCPVTA